ncbi:MAG: hypothetical protein IJH04_10300 [Eggerthellaceae bacterium]|nr:hypothetical protein [Eggerthellaceae bacterium]
MGTLLYWHCGRCKAGELISIGRRSRGLDIADYAEAARSGELGPNLESFFEKGIPKGCEIEDEDVAYRCPSCGGIIPGRRISVRSGGRGWVRYRIRPGPCPRCEEDLPDWEAARLLGTGDLCSHLNSIMRSGCPGCGKGIAPVVVNFGGTLTLNFGPRSN